MLCLELDYREQPARIMHPSSKHCYRTPIVCIVSIYMYYMHLVVHIAFDSAADKISASKHLL